MINDWSINQKDPSKIVTGIDDVKQCYENILFTIPGARPFDYEFGSTLWKYIDAPVNASFAKAAFEIKNSLNKLEPRAIVSKVTRTIDGSTNLLNIFSVFTSTGESFITKIDLNNFYSFDPTYLTVSSQSLEFIAAGESISVTINSNKAWTLTSKPNWITVSASSGNEGLTSISITAPLNSSDIRTGSLTFLTSDNAITTIVAVAQAKKVYTYGRLYNWYAASSRSYGMLYNWYAATDARNIAPAGWHVPSKAEFETLATTVGGLNVAGGKLKETGATYWYSINTGATNEYGFNAIGTGRRYVGGNCSNFYCDLWTSLSYTDANAIIFNIDNNNVIAELQQDSKKAGLGIRLVKDDSTDLGIMTGNDGKQYPTVKIGTQVWLAQNLEETKFRDGSTIPIVTDNTAWSNSTTAGACWYNNTRTYDLAPIGWHLPNLEEYTALQTYLGGNSMSGGKLKEIGTEHWNDPNIGATNEAGFTALGAGYRDTAFSYKKEIGILRMSTNTFSGTNITLGNTFSSITIGNALPNVTGASVRFIKNINSVLTTNPVDAEGNEYETVTIGTQIWTKQNYKSKKWRTGENINVQEIYTDAEWAALTIPACCAYNNDESNV